MLVERVRKASAWIRGRLAISLTLAACLLSGASFGLARAEAPPTQALDAGQVIAQLSEMLAAGQRSTNDHLKRLGFQAEIDRMTTVDGTQLHTFSSRSMIESLYRRVEPAGEGERFLALLYNDAARQSAAIAYDSAFAGLRKFSAEDLKRPFKFVAPALASSTVQKPLPKVVDNAITKLSEFYSGRNLAQVGGVLRRVMQKPGFGAGNFDRAIVEESTARAVLRRLFDEGTPPPRIEVALREVLRQTMAGSAALQFDSAALRLMEDLSKELSPELARYGKVEDQLEGRKRQAAEASRAGKPWKDRPASTREVMARIDVVVAGATRPSSPSAASPNPSSRPPFDPPPPPPPVVKDPINPKGSGGGGVAGAQYERYVENTFEPIGTPPRLNTSPGVGGPTPRGYKVAIRSSRAAPGIAVGGSVTIQLGATPNRAAWVANLKDDRFGRIFVQFASADGKPAMLAASRVLFADSFYAAMDVVSVTSNEQARFRNGEILVLLSMDPDAELTKQEFAKVEAAAKALERQLNAAAETLNQLLRGDVETLRKRAASARSEADVLTLRADSEALRERSASEWRKLEEQAAASDREMQDRANAVPRGIVVHPSIVGRELAWSAARVDFWFNQMNGLSQESAMVNGGHPLPAQLRNISLDSAVTWQFFEQDAVIRFGKSVGGASTLVVASKDSARENARSHFGISMFGKAAAATVDPDRLERLSKLEGEVQPLLDWLAVNHHDFMRLNDFSEAFSLVRWLGSTKTQVTVIDMDGEGEAIATPDRVVIGEGPGVGR